MLRLAHRELSRLLRISARDFAFLTGSLCVGASKAGKAAWVVIVPFAVGVCSRRSSLRWPCAVLGRGAWLFDFVVRLASFEAGRSGGAALPGPKLLAKLLREEAGAGFPWREGGLI